MVTETSALDQCKKCIDLHRSFVLQGGAGSGKTESLKELLLYIKQSQPQAKVVCITHTNAAVEEIVNRVGDGYYISTIHSFLYGLIGNYKKNIKSVIPGLFLVPSIRHGVQTEDISETEYKKDEYEKYKKIYSKYSGKLYSICKENCDKVVNKRDYDKSPENYNQVLNEKIKTLNNKILDIINEKDYSSIIYNETKFDSFGDLSYGHDGLLAIFHYMVKEYPILGKIISDKYDYIFIDEYQDTRAEIMSDMLQLSSEYNLTIGLFGDSMQAIYDDGIGSLDAYIETGMLDEIAKVDNYRCSYEVVELINSLRIDSISQDVALKKLSDGRYENEADRHGVVKILYSVVESKPTSKSDPDEKGKFQKLINYLIAEAQKNVGNSKVLILTNKAIAEKNDFKQLYKVFDERYLDVSDRIESYLRSIQALDVSDLCRLYLKGNYNEVIRLAKKGGYVIHSIADKKRLHDIIHGIINDSNSSIIDIVENAIKQQIIKRTETYRNISARNDNYLKQLIHDDLYQKFKTNYLSGLNTYSRIKDSNIVSSKEEFDFYLSQWEKERFITDLFSSNLKFSEVLNYAKYLDEETNYITMHKTKGTSIPSVIVVMEEYFWNQYDFSLLYKEGEKNVEKKINSQKLIYVACSRAKKNLACVRVLTNSEVEQFKHRFPNAIEISIPSDLLSPKE
ncbi:MAG: ATP-dependent helicase [Clostridiales bacterium]|nr:ATP-dependent helicase [Clostridiales bacterium]